MREICEYVEVGANETEITPELVKRATELLKKKYRRVVNPQIRLELYQSIDVDWKDDDDEMNITTRPKQPEQADPPRSN